jgi:hypothetical protein
MRIFRKRQPASCTTLDAAEARVSDLERRADRVLPWLHARSESNHWREGWDELIYRGRTGT